MCLYAVFANDTRQYPILSMAARVCYRSIRLWKSTGGRRRLVWRSWPCQNHLDLQEVVACFLRPRNLSTLISSHFEKSFAQLNESLYLDLESYIAQLVNKFLCSLFPVLLNKNQKKDRDLSLSSTPHPAPSVIFFLRGYSPTKFIKIPGLTKLGIELR